MSRFVQLFLCSLALFIFTSNALACGNHKSEDLAKQSQDQREDKQQEAKRNEGKQSQQTQAQSVHSVTQIHLASVDRGKSDSAGNSSQYPELFPAKKKNVSDAEISEKQNDNNNNKNIKQNKKAISNNKTNAPENLIKEAKEMKATMEAREAQAEAPRTEQKHAVEQQQSVEQKQAVSKANPSSSSSQNIGENTNTLKPEASVQEGQSSGEHKASLEVLDFVLANQVEGREPKEVVDTFAANQDRGFAFARLNTKANTEVTFVWYRNDHEYARSTMAVHAAKKWRTFHSVKLRPGNWKVQLVENNQVISEKTFTIE